MMPPHPEFFEGYENSPTNITSTSSSSYKSHNPILLHPELCRFEEEKNCQKMDRAFQNQAHRTLQTIHNMGGTLKVLVVLMQFENHSDRPMIDHPDIDQLFNSEGKGGIIVPTGSVKSYLRINSHSHLTIDATIIPWFQVPYTEQYCTHGNRGLDKRFQNCFAPIMDALDAVHVDPEHPFNWRNYDQDMDGYIDSLVVMHSGYGAEWGGTDPDGKDSENRIWSHTIGPQIDRWKSEASLIEVGTYCVTSAFSRHEGDDIARVGIIVHEMIHSFGIPYLSYLGESHGGGVGAYSVMSNPWGPGNDATYPGHLDPWSKIKLGWVTPIPLQHSGTYEMKPSEVGLRPDIFVIDDPFPDGEYLLIENRQPLHFDALLWGDENGDAGGALVWHIDDKAHLNMNPGGPYQEGWPENGKHYQVALLQADQAYDLEQDLNLGESYDFFKHKEDALRPGNSGPGTVYPNTDAYQDGIILSTGLEIDNFRQRGLNMIFDVKGLPDPQAPTDASENNYIPPGGRPVQSRPASSSECIVNVNMQFCANHLTRHLQSIGGPQEGCNCYNFCGNGQFQGCCKFGEECHINCKSGGLVAGCLLEDPDLLATEGSNSLEELTTDKSPAAEMTSWLIVTSMTVLVLVLSP